MRIVTLALLALIPAATSAAAGLDHVAWFDGKVEDAFAQAKEQDKPLFLYWGAVWCPPCNQIKKTIFTRREFAEKMNLFIPVYLDGDTEQAQLWGEKLKAKGYPTMMVFSSEGKEITRLPGGLQLDAFLATLDQALSSMTPISEVLTQVLDSADPAQVPAASWRLLAFYSWGQDAEVGLELVEREAAFRKLAERVPVELSDVRARLFTMWLETAIRRAGAEPEDGAEAFRLSPSEVDQSTTRLLEILTDRTLTVPALDFVTYGAGDTVKLLFPKPSPARTRLIDAWESAAEWVEGNDQLSVDERISALLPALELHQLSYPDKEVPAAFRDRVQKRAWWANESSKDLYTRQAAMSTAGWLLRQVGLEDDARKLYLEQLDKAVSPHYFMSSLSSLADKAGNTEEAVGWLKKAYDAAEGRATRFQWGTSYLLGLMSLVPKDSARIETETLAVFRELLAFDDAFAGRNHARIRRLSKAYGEWNEDKSKAKQIAAVRTALLPSCDGLSKLKDDGSDASLNERCTEFFTQLGS